MPRNLYMHIAILIAVIIVIDQIVKIIIRATLMVGESVTVIPGLLSITHVENSGVAFSLLSGHRGIVTIIQIVAIIVIGIVLFSIRQKSVLYDIALSMILAGGIGNIIDRTLFGTVTDMIEVHFFPPVFNVADIGVTVGCLLLILDIIRNSARS